MKFRESALAHRLLDGLDGIEIGGSAHNPFGLTTRNVDYTVEITAFKKEEIRLCGVALPVDIVSPGDQLPLGDNSVDFVLSSHVIEHFPDPIKALKEWYRVVKPGGYLYIIAPHKERTFDKERPRTTLAELIERHKTGKRPDPDLAHCSVWITEDFIELIRWLDWTILEVQDVDDKVGNGFTVVVQAEKEGAPNLDLAAKVSKMHRLRRVVQHWWKQLNSGRALEATGNSFATVRPGGRGPGRLRPERVRDDHAQEIRQRWLLAALNNCSFPNIRRTRDLMGRAYELYYLVNGSRA